MKKLLYLIISVVVFMTGCTGGNNVEDKESKDESTVKNEKSAEDIETVTTTTNEKTTTAATTVQEENKTVASSVGSDFMYYDLLMEEYSAHSELVNIGYEDYYGVEINGITYRGIFKENDGVYDVYLNSYDLKTNEFDSTKLFSATDRMIDFCDVYIYDSNIYAINVERIDISDSYSDLAYTLYKFDMNGKKLLSTELGTYNYENQNVPHIQGISENGDVLILKSGYYVLISADFNESYEIPKIQVETEHEGVTEEYSASIIGIYNNEIYAKSTKYDNNNVFKYSIDSQKWQALSYTLSDDDWKRGIIVGKYAYGYNADIDCYNIVDLESGEILASVNEVFFDYATVNYTYIPNEFAKFFKFGITNIYDLNDDDSWRSVYINGDGSKRYISEESGMYDGNQYAYVINDEYYCVEDEYGIFLRKYGCGSNDEAVIESFGN